MTTTEKIRKIKAGARFRTSKYMNALVCEISEDYVIERFSNSVNINSMYQIVDEDETSITVMYWILDKRLEQVLDLSNYELV